MKKDNECSIRKDHLRTYKNKCIIASKHTFDDFVMFEKYLNGFINDCSFKKEDTVFITGKNTGVESMIIDWCNNNNFPYYISNINWDKLNVPSVVIRKRKDGSQYNANAPFDRNTNVVKLATHSLIFYDGEDKVITHLLKCCNDRSIRIRTIRHN